MLIASMQLKGYLITLVSAVIGSFIGGATILAVDYLTPGGDPNSALAALPPSTLVLVVMAAVAIGSSALATYFGLRVTGCSEAANTSRWLVFFYVVGLAIAFLFQVGFPLILVVPLVARYMAMRAKAAPARRS
jgi:hypothetical protein